MKKVRIGVLSNLSINNIGDIYKNISVFKKHNHPVTPHWLIDLKVRFKAKRELGIELVYINGYFIWRRSYPMFSEVKGCKFNN